MGKGQKGSSDKKEGKKKKRDESPAPEDGHKCRVCRFPLLVALLQLLLGLAVTVVAFLMSAISPSLLARETPYWAGIIVSYVRTLTSATTFTCLHGVSHFWYVCMTLHDPPFPSVCCPIFPTLQPGSHCRQGKSLSSSNKSPSVIFTWMDTPQSTIHLSHNSLLAPSVVVVDVLSPTTSGLLIQTS